MIILSFITWKLFDEFGWTIYKHIGASVQMRRRYLIYQIFVCLLKFDFFFCIIPWHEFKLTAVLGYEVQSLVIIISITDVEFGLTIAALPITIAILLFCGWSVRHESVAGMTATIVCFFGGLAYFLFKVLFRIGSRSFSADSDVSAFSGLEIYFWSASLDHLWYNISFKESKF